MRVIPALLVLFAFASAASVAVGAGLAWLPAGLIVAGVEGLAASYGGAYVWVRRRQQPPPRQGRWPDARP